MAIIFRDGEKSFSVRAETINYSFYILLNVTILGRTQLFPPPAAPTSQPDNSSLQ